MGVVNIEEERRRLEKKRAELQRSNSDEPEEYDFKAATDRIKAMAVERYGIVEIKHEETDEYRWRIAGIPPKYCPESFGTFKGNDVLVEVCKGIVDTNESLLLQGKSGRGKTHLAVSIAKEKMAKGFSVRFITVIELIDKIMESYKTGRTADVLRGYQGVDILVLDDLAADFLRTCFLLSAV